MSESEQERGKRAGQAAARDRGIKTKAMELAKRRIWPSPPSVAKELGSSVSVVEREVHLLVEARRHWVRLTGRDHSHWKDPDKAPQSHSEQALVKKATLTASAAERVKKIGAKHRHDNRKLKGENAELRELVRRLTLGIRPAEISLVIANETKAA